MSKKSRKRNQAILAALGLGLTLANKGKGMEESNISVDSGRGGDSSSAIARKIAMEESTPVYQDDIMRGGSGVKNMRKIPGMIVPGKRYNMFDSMGFKKGGRVGCGKAKRGFGKAMRKGKK